MGMVRKGFGNVPLKDLTMERKRLEEFEKSLCEDFGWINLVFFYGFFLKIIFGSPLHFMGIRGIYTRVRMECEESGFFKTELAGNLDSWLGWVAISNRGVIEQPVCTFCPVVLQLACLACVQLLATCKPWATREIQSRVLISLHNLEHFFTLSHTLPLHDSHLNTGLLIAKIQANLARNKANKMVD